MLNLVNRPDETILTRQKAALSEIEALDRPLACPSLSVWCSVVIGDRNLFAFVEGLGEGDAAPIAEGV